MNDDVIPIRGEGVLHAGGVVDSSSVSLCIYGESLDPDAVSDLLQTSPTTALRRGERRNARSPESPRGVWILPVEGVAPDGPEQHLRQLLMRLPATPDTWATIRARYQARISVGIHMDSWNRGFAFSPDALRQVAIMGLELDFDIYANSEGEA